MINFSVIVARNHAFSNSGW